MTPDRIGSYQLLARSVDAGYACYEPLIRRPEWEGMRGESGFDRLVDRTRELVAQAREAYDRAGGPALLGPLTPPAQ